MELLFINMVRKGLSVKVPFEERPKGNEAVSYEDFQIRVFKQREQQVQMS